MGGKATVPAIRNAGVLRRIVSGNSDLGSRDRAAQRHGLLALACAILLALTLRVALMNYSLKFDEYASLFFASQSFSRLWSDWMLRETNPPLYYTLLKGWMLLPVPMDRFWLRLPSIVASLLAIPVTYFGINRIYGPKAGSVAALMLAVSAQQIYYAHQMRGYGLMFLALAISFFATMRIVTLIERREPIPTGAWLAYAAGSIVAIYLHTTALFWPAIASASLMLVVLHGRRAVGRFWFSLVLANSFIAICVAWWVYITYLQYLEKSPNISWLQYTGFLESLKIFAKSFLFMRGPFYWQISTIFGICALATFGVFRTHKMIATRLALIGWIVAVLAYLAISQKQAVITESTIVWMTIFPMTLVAAGLATIRTRWRFVAASATFVVLLTVNLALTKKFEDSNWEGAVVAVARDRSGALVVNSEGFGVVTQEACKLAMHLSQCPFPVVTLKNRKGDTWASDFAVPAPADARKALELPVETRLYFIQLGIAQPLKDLQAAGVANDIPDSYDFLAGPYGGIVTQLKARAHVQDGLLILSPARHPAKPRQD